MSLDLPPNFHSGSATYSEDARKIINASFAGLLMRELNATKVQGPSAGKFNPTPFACLSTEAGAKTPMVNLIFSSVRRHRSLEAFLEPRESLFWRLAITIGAKVSNLELVSSVKVIRGQ